jgi:NADP-dependent 3-hydroxy acid dehydrogenase YdfG
MASQNSSDNNNDSFKLANVFNVEKKVALITGGGSGIGLMVTQALAVNGCKVYICGRTEDKLETVAKTYGQDISGQIIPIVADVSKKEDIAKLYEQISQKESHLDM